MDVIRDGSFIRHSPLARRKHSIVFRKFAEFKILPPRWGKVSNYHNGLRAASAKLSSSADVPRKGEFLRKKKENTEPSQGGKNETVVAPMLSKDFREQDAQFFMLEKLTSSGKLETREGRKQHRGDLVWKELQELTREDTGPPRWLSYTGAGNQRENAPLFLCLPDIISNGLSLALHQEKLVRLFEVRRLHVPVNNTSTNEDLITLIEGTLREESSVRKKRPIYLLGEGYGALLAISIAARNPDLDLVLTLVDPATWCDESKILPSGVDVLDAFPVPVSSSLPFLFSMSVGLQASGIILLGMVGDPVTITKAIVDPSLPRLEKSQQFMLKLRDVLQVIAISSAVWSKDVALRKLNLLQMAARSAVSQMGKVKADVLVLYRVVCMDLEESMNCQCFVVTFVEVLEDSGKAQNENEAKRLREGIPSAIGRGFQDRRGALLLEDGVELASLIKACNMYRCSKPRNIVTDYIPPTEEERESFRKAHLDLMKQLFSPVYFHVQENELVKRGLPRLTKERPILLVCNHTFVGFDLGIILGSFLESQDVMIRALAHPLLTIDQPGEIMAPSALPDLARLLGAVPVSGGNLYKLLAAKETAFLLPGGMREAVKRKGESYKLIWPAKPEFVRTAMRHGAVIIPMAAVGGDEFIKIVLDQQEVMSLPIIGEQLQRLGNQMPRARQRNEGADDEGHMLGTVGIPTPPPRMYFTYQKPIYTHELRDSLNDKQVVEALYQQVKAEIEAGISYLLNKRNEDAYQDFVPRILYEKTWGKQAPTFKP